MLFCGMCAHCKRAGQLIGVNYNALEEIPTVCRDCFDKLSPDNVIRAGLDVLRGKFEQGRLSCKIDYYHSILGLTQSVEYMKGVRAEPPFSETSMSIAEEV